MAQKETVASTEITSAKKTEEGWSDILIQNLWTASGSSSIWWTLDVYYQIKQDNNTGISDIYIIGFDFDETNCQNSGNYANGTLTVGAKYGEISNTGTRTKSGTTKLGRWTILLDLTFQFEHDYDGNGILPLQWYGTHTSSSSYVPKITEWQTINITLPKLDARSISYCKINNTWRKGITFIKVNGTWKKNLFYKKDQGSWIGR